MIGKLSIVLVSLLANASGQTVPADKSKTSSSLTNQNPQVVPDLFELGRRAGITEEDHKRLDRVTDDVKGIQSTINWMRGAWWALGAALALAIIVVKFFGASAFVAIEHRMEKARSDAASGKSG